MGVTAWDAGKSGGLAAACLMSGGVTKLGFRSGVTGIARSRADFGADAGLVRDRERVLDDLLSDALKDGAGG